MKIFGVDILFPPPLRAVSDVSPSLLDSDAIREEFGARDDDVDDELSVMQMSLSSSSEGMASHPGPAPPSGNDTCILSVLLAPPGASCPRWFRQLFTSFSNSHIIEDMLEGPVAYIRTWYLDCTAEIASEDSRVVRLSGSPLEWIQDIQRRWQDKIDHNVPVHIAWVYPTPPVNPYEHTIGHMIVFQKPNTVFVPLLISFQFTALRDGTGNAAVVAQKDASPDHIVEIVKLDRVCRGRRCTLHRGTHGGVWGHDLNTGEGLKLSIPGPGEHAHDALHWNPRGVAEVFPASVTIAPPELSFCIEDYTPFFQNLYRRWLRDARQAHASFERTLEITTWYVDGRALPFNDESRPVTLADDFSQWEDNIRNVWTDLVDADAPFIFAFVQPVPPPSPLDRIHVIAMQQIPDDMRGVVITRYDNALYQGAPVSAAAVVPALIDQHALIRHTGLAFGSLVPDTSVNCRVWHGGQEILHQPTPVQHGYGFNVIIHRSLLVDWEHDAEHDGGAPFLLQTSVIKTSKVNDESDATQKIYAAGPAFAPQGHIKVNLQKAAETLLWFDQHFVLPCFDIQSELEGIAHWHPTSLEWIFASEWFASEQRVDKIRIYYDDGSFAKTTGVIGFAAAAFVHFHDQWHFAGAISGRAEETEDLASYKAELNAALLALKFLYDLVKIQFECFGARPSCALVFDSMSVGYQTAGLWKSTRAIHACHLARSILRLCESRFQVECDHVFSPGHSGEPGNELVDVLAGCAVRGSPLQDWAHFVKFTQRAAAFVLAPRGSNLVQCTTFLLTTTASVVALPLVLYACLQHACKACNMCIAMHIAELAKAVPL